MANGNRLFAGGRNVIASDKTSLSSCNESLSGGNYTYVPDFQSSLFCLRVRCWRSDVTRGEKRQFNKRIDVGGYLTLSCFILAFMRLYVLLECGP